MLLVMHKEATGEEIDSVMSTVTENGYTPHPIPGGERLSIGNPEKQGVC